MQLKYNIYTQLVQQKQLASAKLIEQTPVFTVVQSATVPLKKSKPKRMIITLAFVFLAFCGTTLFIENKKQKVE